MEKIKFRKAILDDMENVYHLSNDPDVRKVSINKSQILWDDHVKWFSEKIKNDKVIYLIAYTDKIPFLGQVRFDLDETGDSAVINFSIVQEFRGKGYGYSILRNVCSEASNKYSLKKINAYVQPDNTASLKLFIKACFVSNGEETIKNNVYNLYSLKLSKDRIH